MSDYKNIELLIALNTFKILWGPSNNIFSVRIALRLKNVHYMLYEISLAYLRLFQELIGYHMYWLSLVNTVRDIYVQIHHLNFKCLGKMNVYV